MAGSRSTVRCAVAAHWAFLECVAKTQPQYTDRDSHAAKMFFKAIKLEARKNALEKSVAKKEDCMNNHVELAFQVLMKDSILAVVGQLQLEGGKCDVAAVLVDADGFIARGVLYAEGKISNENETMLDQATEYAVRGRGVRVDAESSPRPACAVATFSTLGLTVYGCLFLRSGSVEVPRLTTVPLISVQVGATQEVKATAFARLRVLCTALAGYEGRPRDWVWPTPDPLSDAEARKHLGISPDVHIERTPLSRHAMQYMCKDEGERGIVAKAFHADGTRSANLELVRKFVDKRAVLLSVGGDTEEEEEEVLVYKHVWGTHYPQTLSQVGGVLTVLEVLLGLKIVHGDIRAANIVWPDEGDAVVIDWDFAGRDGGERYPEGFAPLTERHREATPGAALEHEHDWHSAAEVVDTVFGGESGPQWAADLVGHIRKGEFKEARTIVGGHGDVVYTPGDSSLDLTVTGSPEKKKK